MPDDVVPDGYGNLLVIDLEPSIHALIRMNLANTAQREVLASQGSSSRKGWLLTHMATSSLPMITRTSSWNLNRPEPVRYYNQ